MVTQILSLKRVRGTRRTCFKSSEPVADRCSALFGRGICDSAQPSPPTQWGVLLGQRVPLPHSHQPLEGSHGLHFWRSSAGCEFSAIFFFFHQKPEPWQGLVFHRGLLSQVLTGVSCIPGHRSLLPQKPHFFLSSPLG